LKKRFTKAPVLAVPYLNKNENKLDYTMEGVLLIECEDGKWRVVAYLSKSLNKTERNYNIYDKEMLVVIRSLENWRYLLESIKFKFEL